MKKGTARRKRLSQADLAERIGVSRQAVNAIETDKDEPSLDPAFRVAPQPAAFAVTRCNFGKQKL
jgi:DNA-binding XRE family transcriptional regulator